MPKHPTVEVRVRDWVAHIDVEIAPLVEEIWNAGIPTTFSCQGEPNEFAWIEFLNCLDGEEFLNIVAGDYKRDLHSIYNRISHGFLGDDGQRIAIWRYTVRPWDLSVFGETSDDFDGAEHRQFIFSLCIEFPNSDIPLLTEWMRRFNESERGATYRAERGVA